MIIKENFSESEKLQHARHIIRDLSFFSTFSRVAERNHPGGWQKKSINQFALTMAHSWNYSMFYLTEKTCSANSAILAPANYIRVGQYLIPCLAWNRPIYPFEKKKLSCLESSRVFLASVWRLKPTSHTIYPLTCTPFVFFRLSNQTIASRD